MGDSLIKKFVSFSYGNWIGLIIGLLGTIVTTRILLPEDFGKASMFTLTLNIFMIIIIFGTDQSFGRFFYVEEEGNRGKLLYNCLKIPLLITLVIIILIFFYNSKISLFLFEEENLLVVVMLVLGIIFQVLFRYSTLVIRMQQKGNLYSLIQILFSGLNIIILLVLYLIMGASYKIIIYATVINLIILTIFSVLNEKHFWRIKNLKATNLVHTKREIIKFGSPLVLTLLITWLFQSIDKIALKHWSNFQELGLYAAAFKIIALVNVLQTTFSTFWVPVAYEKFEKNPNDKEFFSNMFNIITFAMLFVAVLSIAGKDIIVILLGENYRAAANIMPFLVFMPLMYTISETTVVGINFYKKTNWHILIASVSCLINILGNWLLVPQYGAIGASISTALSYIIFFVLRTNISLRYFKVNYGLRKLYFMLLLVLTYATFSLFIINVYLNILMGIFIIFIITFGYRSNLIKEYEILRNKNSFGKLSKKWK